MEVLPAYLVPLFAMALVGLVLWRSGNPSSFGYVAFSVFAGVLTFMVVVDTGWYRRVPVGGGSGAASVTADLGKIEERLADLADVGPRMAAMQEDLVGYITEVFNPRDVGGAAEVGDLPDTEPFKRWVRFKLKGPPVPDSVLVWENGLLAAPSRFSVERDTVTVKTLIDPRADRLEYVIRYFRWPDGNPGPGGDVPRPEP
jgi:hypothetical protein